MGKASRRLEQRNRAAASLDAVFRSPDLCNVIHYSCESFYDNPSGRSSRITSIAVRNLGTGATVSFSLHIAAEKKGVDPERIEGRYDELELNTLDAFYDFVGRHQTSRWWMNWNMRDTNFGFPAIAHRYEVLGGNALDVPPEKLVNLSSLLGAIYGPDYIGHPRMKQLADYNDLTMRAFLSGEDEAIAFEKGNYVTLHQSTLRKVEVIATLAERQWQGTLRTEARLVNIYGTTLAGWVERWTDSAQYKLAGGLALAFALFQGVLALLSLLGWTVE